METSSDSILDLFSRNETFTTEADVSVKSIDDYLLLLLNTVGSIGIITNLTVIVVFLNHKKLRRKIPNIFIINQVRTILLSSPWRNSVRNPANEDDLQV